MSTRVKNASRNMVWGLINKCIAILLPFIMRTVIIRILGTEYLGLDSLFTSVLQMLNVVELGFNSAIIFSMYKPIAEEDVSKICALLSFYRKIYRIVGAAILLIGLLLIPLLPYFIKGTIPNDLNLYILYLIYLFNTVAGYWSFAYKKVLLTAHQREDVNSIINIVIMLGRNTAQIILLVLTHNFYFYLITLVAGTAFENIYVALVTKRLYPQYVCKNELERKDKKEIKRQVKGLMIQKICATSRNSVDNIIISSMLGLTAVTLYGNYYSIMAGLHAMFLCITHAIEAGIGDSIATKDRNVNYQDMLRFDFMYMWLASIGTICLFCLYQPVIKLWMGEDLMLPIKTVILLAAYFYSLCAGDIRSLYTVGAGLWWEGRYRSILEAASNIVLNIVLGKYWGISGIIVATLFSIVIINWGYGSTIVHRFYFKKRTTLFYKNHIVYAVITCVAAGICYVICEQLPLVGIANIILRVSCCVLTGNGCFMIAFCHTNEWRENIKYIKYILKNIGW